MWEGGEGVGESGKDWYFYLSVGKSGGKKWVSGCGKEWVEFIKPRKEQDLANYLPKKKEKKKHKSLHYYEASTYVARLVSC